jgi:hypothetical protein
MEKNMSNVKNVEVPNIAMKNSVEQTVEQTSEVNLNLQITDVDSVIKEVISELRAKADKQLSTQNKANTQLYMVLEGCLRIINMCAEDEGIDKALRLLAMSSANVKKTDGVPTTTLVSKLVFATEDKSDKRAYSYAKALEKAIFLKLQTEENEQKLSTYLSENGGVDKLIRLNTDEHSSESFADERFGTNEHFAEWIYDELAKEPSKRNDFVQELSKSKMLKINLTKEMKAQLGAFDNMNCFMSVHWTVGSDEATVSPYIIGRKNDKETYKSLTSIEHTYVAKVVRKETSDCWNKYLKQCEKRSNEIRKQTEEKQTIIANELRKVLEVCN